MSGPGHTNLVCSMATTSDRLISLGLDKNLKSASTSTNEYRLAMELVPSHSVTTVTSILLLLLLLANSTINLFVNWLLFLV